jgi:hypothetical protein
MQVVVLEPSTNTHRLQSESVEVMDLGRGILKVKTSSQKGIVTHGEHGTLVTVAENIIKYVQQEVNPITKKLENAFD